MKTHKTKLLTLAFLIGSTALASAAIRGKLDDLYPPGNGTGHGVALVNDDDGNTYRVRTPLESGLPLEIGDELEFDVTKGSRTDNAVLIFGDPDFCFLSVEVGEIPPMHCEFSPDVELSDETKLSIRNAARKLSEDNGPTGAQVIITKI